MALDGVKLDGVTMIEKLNKLGGENGIGIVDMVENRLVGMKSRGVYETPGGSILYKAHEALETICLDRDTQHYKQQMVAGKFSELVYYGQWFTPLRQALSAFVDNTQEYVTGDVKLKLYKGNMILAGILTSPYSLYDEEIATFDEDEVYDQMDSQGFINLFGLPIQGAGAQGPVKLQTGKTGIWTHHVRLAGARPFIPYPSFHGAVPDDMIKETAMKTVDRTVPKGTIRKRNDFNSSISFDSRMAREDILGSMAHAAMLAKQGIISAADGGGDPGRLAGILADLESGALSIDMGRRISTPLWRAN